MFLATGGGEREADVMPNESYNLMLDPSMLLDFEARERILSELPNLREEAQIFLPYGFIRFLAGYDPDQEEDPREHPFPGVPQQFVWFYRGERGEGPKEQGEWGQLAGLDDLVQNLQEEGLVRYYNARENEAAPPHFWIIQYLYRDLSEAAVIEEGPYQLYYFHLPDTLFDEWVFLQENSWILAKARHAFDQMVHAGGVALQWAILAANRGTYSET
jgi:hypothetical protein